MGANGFDGTWACAESEPRSRNLVKQRGERINADYGYAMAA